MKIAIKIKWDGKSQYPYQQHRERIMKFLNDLIDIDHIYCFYHPCDLNELPGSQQGALCCLLSAMLARPGPVTNDKKKPC